MKTPCLLSLPILLITTVIGAPAATAEPDRVTVQPQDTRQALINPSMGWTLHYYSNIITNYGSRLAPSDLVSDFPGMSTIYLRVPWSFLEPNEGQFDWSLLDTPAQRWIEVGKQIALRITCSESWLRYATPKWVEQAGAKGYNFTPGKGTCDDGLFWEPDYGDPVFLKKLDAFLHVLATRYDGNPNVAFIDIGSYGVWGEGHTFSSTRRTYDDSVKRKHIDLYRNHFQKTLLALNDDFVGPGVRAGRAPLTDYAMAHGITLRDDSILVQPPPRSWYHAELARAFWPHLPVILEHEHYGPSKQKKAWSGALLLKSVEDYHASYMSIHWWPRELLEENRPAIDQINLRLGYRLRLQQASWPQRVRLNQSFTFRSVWTNAGVAPCYPGGHVAVTLKDAAGGLVAVLVDAAFNVRSLKTGIKDKMTPRQLESRFVVARKYVDGPRQFAPATKPGQCDLFISVGQLDGTPVIALPLKNDDGHRRYKLGSVQLSE